MRRVVILGNAGSGKSTLAAHLAERLGAPAIHLDALFWGPGWSEPPIEAFRERLAEAHAGEAWVSDGNYAAATFDLRLPRAEAVVWLERPWPLCALRALRRAVRGQFDPAERLAPGCRDGLDRRLVERLRFITGFERRNRPRIEALIARLRPDIPVVRLLDEAQAAGFLADPDTALALSAPASGEPAGSAQPPPQPAVSPARRAGRPGSPAPSPRRD